MSRTIGQITLLQNFHFFQRVLHKKNSILTLQLQSHAKHTQPASTSQIQRLLERTTPSFRGTMNRFLSLSDPTEILSIRDEIDSDESDGYFDGYLEGSYIHCTYQEVR